MSEERLGMGYVRRDGVVYNGVGNEVEYEELEVGNMKLRRVDFNVFDENWYPVGTYHPLADLPVKFFNRGFNWKARIGFEAKSVLIAETFDDHDYETSDAPKRIIYNHEFNQEGDILLTSSYSSKKVLFKPFAKINICPSLKEWVCCERWKGESIEDIVNDSELEKWIPAEIITPYFLFSINGKVWVTEKGLSLMRSYDAQDEEEYADHVFFTYVEIAGEHYFGFDVEEDPHWKNEYCEDGLPDRDRE